MRSRGTLTILIFASLSVYSCAGPIPPIPKLSLEGVDGEVRNAIATAQKDVMAAPDSGQAVGRLGMVLQANSLYQPAMLSYERAIRLDPKEFAWRYYLALVLQKLSQPEKALDALTGALKVRSDYAPALLKRGELLFDLARLKESSTAYESLLAQNPSSAAALYGLARVKQALGEISAAEDLYRRASHEYPTFGAAYYGLATAGRALGHDAESAKSFDLAKQYYGDLPPAADGMLDRITELSTGVNSHIVEAYELTRKGKMEQAARLNEELLAQDPENLNFLLNLLYSARFVNRLDDQVDTLYEKAKRIDPRGELVYDYYGVVKVRQGKYNEASSALHRAMELRPEDAEPYKFLGEIADRQNRSAEAIDYFRRALAAEPADRELQMKLWWTLILNGRGRETIPELLAALAVEDSFTSTRMFLLGEAYRTTGDFEKSRRYLEQARDRMRSQGPSDSTQMEQGGMLAQIEQDLKQLSSAR